MATTEKSNIHRPRGLADLEAVCNTKGIVRDPKLVRRITERSDQVRQDTLKRFGVAFQELTSYCLVTAFRNPGLASSSRTNDSILSCRLRWIEPTNVPCLSITNSVGKASIPYRMQVSPVPSARCIGSFCRVGTIEKDPEGEVAILPGLLAGECDAPVVFGPRLDRLIVEAHDDQRLALEPLVKFDEIRHGADAWTTPISPKVENHHLAAEVSQMDWPAGVNVRCFDFGGQLADHLLMHGFLDFDGRAASEAHCRIAR